MANPDNRGQQKLHKIRNTNTGEEREVTQADWRVNGKTLKAEGFERVDEDGTVIPDEEPTSGT